jgi:hypothetical protein
VLTKINPFKALHIAVVCWHACANKSCLMCGSLKKRKILSDMMWACMRACKLTFLSLALYMVDPLVLVKHATNYAVEFFSLRIRTKSPARWIGAASPAVQFTTFYIYPPWYTSLCTANKACKAKLKFLDRSKRLVVKLRQVSCVRASH